MLIVWRAHTIVAAALFLAATDFGARAQSPQTAAQHSAQAVADVFHEAESKYLFGFTDGADIGNEGEMAFNMSQRDHSRSAVDAIPPSSMSWPLNTCRRRISRTKSAPTG